MKSVALTLQIAVYETFTEALNALIESVMRADSHCSKKMISEHLGVSQSTLSKILQGQQNASLDFVYAISELVCLRPESFRYFRTLWELESCASHAAKDQIRATILELKRELLQSENYLKADFRKDLADARLESYFLDPECLLLHNLLSIPRFEQSLENARKVLKLDSSIFDTKLSMLEDLGFIAVDWKFQRVKVLKRDLYLSQESNQLKPHQLAMKVRSLARTQSLPTENSKSTVLTFSSNKDTVAKIQHLFSRFLSEVGELVLKDKADNLYQMNFELFSWTEFDNGLLKNEESRK